MWETVMLLEHIKYHPIPTPITYTCITKYRKTLYKAQPMFESQINKMGFGPEIMFTRISKGRAQASSNQQEEFDELTTGCFHNSFPWRT